MALPRSKSWLPALLPVLATLGYVIGAPQPASAIPAFARKFGLKCYSCHTIPPALNKTGYTFKRLGYRMPPDEMDGSKPAPKVSELVTGGGTNAVALSFVGGEATLFTAKCSKCHTIARPLNTMMTKDEWSRYVKRMMHKPNSGISDTQGKQIYDFMVYDQTERKDKNPKSFFPALSDEEIDKLKK
jgi:mono/diheme cytochrome c family protein